MMPRPSSLPLPDEGDDDLPVTKSYATCGQPYCCRSMATPTLMDGITPFHFRETLPTIGPSAAETMPMACGGDLWIPRPGLRKKTASRTPAGLAQFKKPE